VSLLLAAAALVLLMPAAAGFGQDLSEQMDTGAWVQRGQWPTFQQFLRVFLLKDYNTRVVVIGTMLLGLAGGIIGTFLLLKKRSLLADAVSHATLPGIALAFIAVVFAGGEGKSLPILLGGALITGLLGMGFVILITKITRLKEDAALGIVLSVFFGLGIALLGVIQKMKSGHAAGLESFIYGKTASMLANDALIIGIASLVIIVASVLLFKEFKLLCFDPEFASSQGWPVMRLEALLMGLVVAVTVIGLQSVGLILVIALLIIPPAAARFWTEKLSRMLIISAVFGALSGNLGTRFSALVPRLPAGAIIVVTASLFFFVSLVAGATRGALVRAVRQARFRRRVSVQHLLRALYEHGEAEGQPGRPVHREALADIRSWSPGQLNTLLRRADHADMVHRENGSLRLTERGLLEAQKVVRNHRLWETYLIRYADVATSRVDHGADEIEHVLGTSLVADLEKAVKEEFPGVSVPPSPHNLAAGGSSGGAS
jgi:manganese/zinc/iron transport system permease protein